MEGETSPSKSQLRAGWKQFREELVSQGQEKSGRRTEVLPGKAAVMWSP